MKNERQSWQIGLLRDGFGGATGCKNNNMLLCNFKPLPVPSGKTRLRQFLHPCIVVLTSGHWQWRVFPSTYVDVTQMWMWSSPEVGPNWGLHVVLWQRSFVSPKLFSFVSPRLFSLVIQKFNDFNSAGFLVEILRPKVKWPFTSMMSARFCF